jgi:tripartite-type tricarboxylate transporter receptor subunit TctC
MNFRSSLKASAALVAAIAALLSQPAHAQFYKGKTLTILVNFSAGGNADTTARMFQRHWSKHIPGNPAIVIQNAPGAGGYTAMNLLGLNVNRPPDGFTIGYFGISPSGLIAKDPGLRVTLRDYAMVGAVRDWDLAYARKDAPPGIKAPADIAKVTQIFAGGYSRSNSNDARSSLSLTILNVPFKMITGFQGTADLNKALIQNEINFVTSALPAFRRLTMPQIINTGIAIPLYYYPVQGKDGLAEDIPVFENMGVASFQKLYQQINGKPPSGPRWQALLLSSDLDSNMHGLLVLPKDAPPDAVAALRQGFDEMANDSEFVAEYQNLTGGPPSLTNAEQLVPMVDRLDHVDEGVKAVVKEMVGG